MTLFVKSHESPALGRSTRGGAQPFSGAFSQVSLLVCCSIRCQPASSPPPLALSCACRCATPLCTEPHQAFIYKSKKRKTPRRPRLARMRVLLPLSSWNVGATRRRRRRSCDRRSPPRPQAATSSSLARGRVARRRGGPRWAGAAGAHDGRAGPRGSPTPTPPRCGCRGHRPPSLSCVLCACDTAVSYRRHARPGRRTIAVEVDDLVHAIATCVPLPACRAIHTHITH